MEGVVRRSKGGFTIVELLVVIVVIAILAAITVVAYNGIQIRAQATGLASDLKATEKAFNAYKAVTGASSWWIDNDAALTGSGNPAIVSIISAQSEFRNFLQKAPSNTILGATSAWVYDSDGDVYDGCSASTTGVSLALNGATNTSLMQAIDNAVDDGNLACGKVRFSSPWFLYGLSNQS
jgi:prepilin-type N-terminal cleavage/methylation domain-containing protein